MRDSLKFFLRWQELYQKKLRDELFKDEYLVSQLSLLEQAILKSRSAFESTGSFAFCAKCAQKGVKCCQADLEWVVSPAEFILNLMLADLKNTKIEFNYDRFEDCLFLGERGCNLILTPIFCRNFFCPELAEYLGKEKLIVIQNAMEDEANLGFKLGDYLNKTYLEPYK
ncbi:MAG: hypothetical protein GXO57_02490 [Thermodesulfobacteria bacterium]|nr:hypothetical protein [Thermodesulfobacteriota bacterium]